MDPESTSGGYSFVMKDTNWEGQPNEVAHRMVSGRVPSFPALTLQGSVRCHGGGIFDLEGVAPTPGSVNLICLVFK